MIKSKYFNGLVAVLIVCALVFTIMLTYFSDDLSIEKTSNQVTKLYETELFDKNEVMSVDIQMDEDTWSDMIDNASSEEYVLCDVVINGTTYKNIGIRPKGNTSLSQIASDDTTDRFSFKIEFDHYVNNQDCYGLDKLVLNNMMSDTTYMKEYLAYDMMDYMGVASPLYSYASISVNGEAWGLYLALEGLEEAFAERNYGTDYGQLYKPESTNIGGNTIEGGKGGIDLSDLEYSPSDFFNQYQTDDNPIAGNDITRRYQTMPDQINMGGGQGNGQGIGQGNNQGNGQGIDQVNRGDFFGGSSIGGTDLQYVDDEISSYSAIFDSAVFDSDNSDYERVIEALKSLSNGTELEKYIDVEATLRYFAVNTVLVNFDSYVGSLKHNYYLYEDNGLLTMLPWDFNLAFAGFQTNDASTAVNSPIDTPVSDVTLSDRPILGKLLEVEEYKNLYHSYLQEIITDYFESGLYEQTITSMDDLISDLVAKDITAFYTIDEYNTGVDTLTTFGLLRAESIQGQLDGTIPSTDTEQIGKEELLIDATGINIATMGTQGGGNMGGGQGDFIGGFGRNNTDNTTDSTKTDGTFQEDGTIQDDVRFGMGRNNTYQNFNTRNSENSNMNTNGVDSNLSYNLIVLFVGIILLIGGLVFMKNYRRKKYRA